MEQGIKKKYFLHLKMRLTPGHPNRLHECHAVQYIPNHSRRSIPQPSLLQHIKIQCQITCQHFWLGTSFQGEPSHTTGLSPSIFGHFSIEHPSARGCCLVVCGREGEVLATRVGTTFQFGVVKVRTFETNNARRRITT